jgi:ribosomal protein L14E/L6E/L27E
MSHKKPTPGDIYAVHTGVYAGELLIYIKRSGDKHCFLATPKMENRNVPIKSFENARNSDIIKYVEKAPSYVTKVSEAQYIKNETSYHRRKQLGPQDLLDGEDSI